MEVNICVSKKELSKLIQLPWELSNDPQQLLLLSLYEKYGVIKIYDDIDDLGDLATLEKYENREDYEILRKYILYKITVSQKQEQFENALIELLLAIHCIQQNDLIKAKKYVLMANKTLNTALQQLLNGKRC